MILKLSAVCTKVIFTAFLRSILSQVYQFTYSNFISDSFEGNLDDKKLLNRLLELLSCENTYVRTSVALAIGNFAKNGMLFFYTNKHFYYYKSLYS